MNTLSTVGMYEIYKLSDDLYQVHSSVRGVTAMEGSMVAIVTYMVTILKFEIDEIEFALVDMLQKDNDAAHFGMFGGFIYSFKRVAKYGKVA